MIDNKRRKNEILSPSIQLYSFLKHRRQKQQRPLDCNFRDGSRLQIIQHSASFILCKNPLQGQADHLLKLVFFFKKKTFKICIQSNTFQCYIYISLYFVLIPSCAAFPFPSRYPPAKLSVLLFSYLISIINKSFRSFWLKKKGGSDSLHSRMYFSVFPVLWPSKNYCQLSVQLRDIDSHVALATHELSGLCDSNTQRLISSSWLLDFDTF